MQMKGKLACTCCRPLVDLEWLSCYHRSLSSLGKQQTFKKKMAADEWQTGLYLLHALSRVGTARLSPLQFVSDWKTTNPSTKRMAAGE